VKRTALAKEIVSLAKALVAAPVTAKFSARYNQWSGGRQANISVDVELRFSDADARDLSSAILSAEAKVGKIADAVGAKNNEWYQDEGWSADNGRLFSTYQIEPRDVRVESLPDVFRRFNVPLFGDFMDD
jgi:hypothetical protein